MNMKSWKIVRANERWAKQDDREQQYMVCHANWLPFCHGNHSLAELGMSEGEMQEYLVRLGKEIQFAAYEQDPEKGMLLFRLSMLRMHLMR